MLLEPCGSSVQRIFKGVQYDRITAVWLDDANFFRTSTAAPTINDVLWTVTKDVTRYSSLLVMGNISLSVMLENLVDNVYTDKQCTGDCEVQAKIIDSGTPDLEMEQPSSFEGLDRSCEVETKRKSQYYGWVKSSVGNLTTTVSRDLKLKNKIKFYEKGNEKKVTQKVKEEIEISVESETGHRFGSKVHSRRLAEKKRLTLGQP
ncbi:Peptide-N4-(N-acetyl-beta-glucosaminyl)asparagine amidase A [Capsicum baccatum]|uniref:Peptide-N4-(N-acetyl-beta-glucosaminyl)asparagine amidase A n=1 Tax=Capsicum baccatum TaxID=33114 RepID=A0A2G2VFH0_CAPBA|nr:Peptide-N4-(N-acetyl-beta-glucosaminyl)asparagine amidase A [Capsicum baccatum]